MNHRLCNYEVELADHAGTVHKLACFSYVPTDLDLSGNCATRSTPAQQLDPHLLKCSLEENIFRAMGWKLVSLRLTEDLKP